MNEYLKNQNIIWYAFHKGDKGEFKDKAVSEIIKLFTYRRECRKLFDSQFSHVETVFPMWVIESDSQNKNCFSSRGMDTPRGVYFKYISFSHPDRWFFLPDLVQGSKEKIIERYNVALSMVGMDYDMLGVVRTFGLKKSPVDDPKKAWCSEVCAKVAGLKNPLISPNDMALEIYHRNSVFGKSV